MPLPDGVPTFTLVAAFPPLAPDGVERQGSLTFTPVPNLLADADFLFTGVENATLNATGGMSKTLVACDALDEPFVWRVDGQIDGQPPFSVNISVPASAGTVNLGAAAEFAALPPDYVVILGPQGLAGARGDQGPVGSTGPAGSAGAAGASAYDVAVANGFVGTQPQWLASLVGPQGPKGDPGTGGGGGVVPVWYIADLNGGIIHLPGPTASWTPVTGNGITIAHDILDVATGDVIEMDVSFLRIGASMQLDARFVVGGTPVRYFSAFADLPAAPGPEGEPMWYSGASFKTSTATRAFLVEESWGVTAGSTVRVEMVYQGTDIPADNSHTLYWGNGYPGRFDGRHWKIGAR